MIESKTANTSITQTLIEIIRKQAKQDKNTVLEQINNTINWNSLVRPIEEKIDSTLVGESKTFNIKTIFKCFILQTIYELSNHELAVEISDRKSFQKFLDMQYGDTIPKEDTLSFFRELLIQENLYDEIFNAFYEQLLDAKFQMLTNIDDKNTQFYQDYGIGKEVENEGDMKYKLGVQSRVDITDELFNEIENMNLEGSEEVSKENSLDNNGNHIDEKIDEIEKRIRMLYERKSQGLTEEPKDTSEDVTLGDKLKKVDDEIKMINQEPEELYEKTDQIYQKLLQIDSKIGELYDIPKEEVSEKELSIETVEKSGEDDEKSEKLLNKLMEIDGRLQSLHKEPVEQKEAVEKEELTDVNKESKTNELYDKLTQIDHRLKELYEKPDVEDKAITAAEEIVEKAKELKTKEDIEKEEIREEELDKIEQVEDKVQEVVEDKIEEAVEDKIEEAVEDKIEEAVEDKTDKIVEEKADVSEKGDIYKKLFDSFYSHLIDANIVKESEKDSEMEIEDVDIKPVFSKDEITEPEAKEEEEIKEEPELKEDVELKEGVELKEEKLEQEEEAKQFEDEGVLESQEFKMRSEEIDDKVKEIEDHYKLLFDKEIAESEVKEEEEIKEEPELKEEKIEEVIEAPEIEEKLEKDITEVPEEIKEAEDTYIETTEDKLKKIDEEIKRIYQSSEIEKPVVEIEEPEVEIVKEEEPELKEAPVEVKETPVEVKETPVEVKEELVEETKEIEVEKISTAFMQPPVEVQEPEVKEIKDNEIDLKKKRKVEIFNDSNLTEDYELGLRFYKLGFKTAFINMTTNSKDVMARIATSEYFPNTFWGAVKQRSRWIAGIAFQNWKIHKWKGSLKTKYFLFRDRKSLISAIGILLSNIVFAYFVIYLASITFNFQFTIPLIEKGTVLWFLMIGTFFFMVSRLIHRFAFTYNWYGLRYAIFSIVRLPFDNIINIFATARAFKVYRTNKKKVVWDSTDHY